jgi:DNA-binding transcriptional LysR family regulator
MNFELVDLKAFVAIADLGSFVRAAKALNLSQPALSRRIQKLEESLGAALLERSTRHVALTMVGRDFVPKVRRFLGEFETSVLGISELGARSSGLVSIASVPTAVFYFLPLAIRRFSHSYPRIRVRILDIGANEGLAAVARGEADFGVNFIGASHPEIDFTPLAEDPFVVACRRDHELASRRQITWDELAAHRVIMVGRNSGNRTLIDSALAQRGLRLNWSYEVMHLRDRLDWSRPGSAWRCCPSSPRRAMVIRSFTPFLCGNRRSSERSASSDAMGRRSPRLPRSSIRCCSTPGKPDRKRPAQNDGRDVENR